MKVFRIRTDYGFAGTDDERVFIMNDDVTQDGLFQDVYEEMLMQISCDVEEIENPTDQDLEYAEDYTG